MKDPRKPKKDEDEEDDGKPPAREITYAASPNNSHNHDSIEDDTIDSTSTRAETPLPNVAALTPATSPQVIKHVSPSASIARRRQWLREEIVVLSGTSIVSIIAFLYIMLPFTALVSLAVALSSTALMAQSLARHARLEYSNITQYRGFADFLPDWLRRMLTEESFHSWFTNDEFPREYQHLLIYFIPFIPRTQLDTFVSQLAPRHREALHRPGLGWYAGRDFMRLMLGEERINRMERTSLMYPDRSPEAMSARRLYGDDESSTAESDLGLDVQSNDLAGRLNDEQATNIVHRLGINENYAATNGTVGWSASNVPPNTTNTPRDDDDEEEEDNLYAREEQVLFDAFLAAVSAAVTPVINYAATRAAEFIRPTTTTLIRISFGISAVSSGLGLFGYWRGVYNMPPRPGMPSSQSLWTTAILGGASAGLLYVARSYLPTNNTRKTNTKSKIDKKD